MQREVVAKHWSGVTLQKLTEISQDLLKQFPAQKVWLFHGDMGVGKTTIIKKICEGLGVKDTMGSPTFTLVNEYEGAEEKKIYHFDFYRIKDEREAMAIGIEEYFYSGNYCFIEWPEKVATLLPPGTLDLTIKTEGPDHRTIEVTTNAH